MNTKKNKQTIIPKLYKDAKNKTSFRMKQYLFDEQLQACRDKNFYYDSESPLILFA